MASVSVNYQFRTFKTKFGSNSNLNEVVEKSVSYFKLALNEGTKFVLLHNKTIVALDLPWRLLNLPMGVKLDLVEVKDTTSDGVKAAVPTIKVRFLVNQHYGSIVLQVKIIENTIDAIKKVSIEQKWDDRFIQSSNIKLQIFSKMYNIQELEGQSFESLGITESMSIRINLPEIDSVETPVEIKSDENIKSEDIEMDVAPEEAQTVQPEEQLHQPVAYIPSETPIVDQIMGLETETDFEMTVEQARRYQHILARQTGNLGGPLMTKRLREELDKKNRPKIIVKKCLIRVKFPDLTYLEISFSPTDTMAIVYDQIRDSLINRDQAFNLYQTHPHQYLNPSNDEELVKDLKFVSKTVLAFEPQGATSRGPFLKASLLQQASELSLENTEPVTKPTIMKNEAKETPSKKTLKKVPKWLKLSKK